MEKLIEVKKFSPKEWELFSEDAHRICFAEIKPKSFDRIDFALLCVMDGRPAQYVTCREYDHETVYWQFGGSFPGTRDSVRSWACYQRLTDFCQARYKRITTLIENKNIVMLKFAMKMGYRIIGIRNFANSVLLEHVLEFEKEI